MGLTKEINCTHYENPKNGMVRCGGQLCLVMCDPGYISDRRTAFVYRCIEETKQWKTLPEGKMLPWPNCRKLPEVNSLEVLRQ